MTQTLNEQNLHESQGGLLGLNPLRSDWFSGQSGGEAVLREQWPKAAHLRPSGSSPLRLDGFHDGKTRRLDGVIGGQRRSSEPDHQH
jgi:hypothetical protein